MIEGVIIVDPEVTLTTTRRRLGPLPESARGAAAKRRRNNLATVLAEQPGRASEAITYIDRAIELVGAQPNLLDTKGTILLTLGQEEEAVKLLNAATPRNSDPRYYLHLAVGRFRVGDVDKAREALEFANKHELSRQVLTQSDTQMLAELNENVR